MSKNKDLFESKFKELIRQCIETKERVYKNKKPSKKFELIQKSLEILNEILKYDDPKISLEYDLSDVIIYVEDLGFGVANKEMPKWRELMEIVDTFDFSDTEAPGYIEAEFVIFDVFEPIK